MLHNILNEISLILPNSITFLIKSFIGLAYEGISSNLHNRWQKAMHQAFVAMEKKVDIQCNKIVHLENSMVMYGFYNSGTLEKLINTVHKMYNTTTWNEKLFAGKLIEWYNWYLSKNGISNYAIDSLLCLRTVREKYIHMYEVFISQLHMYEKAVGILSKGYLPISLLPPLKLQEILTEVERAIQTTNPDYDIVIKRLHLYYDMKLITFGIDRDNNL